MNDIIINKIQSIHRCIKRAREEYHLAGSQFNNDFSRQDAAILNITRACEQAIDLSNVVIKKKQLGIPGSSREAFTLLATAGIISNELSIKLQRMVGFRNTVIHEYQHIDIAVVQSVITQGLNELLEFTDIIMDLSLDQPR